MREVRSLGEFTSGFGEFFRNAYRGLKTRLNKEPINSVEGFVRFVETRSAYVAQTSLYGYLKTRMGMKFRELFQDKTYSHSIRLSSEKLFLSCAADLTVFMVSAVAESTSLTMDQGKDLARHTFKTAVACALNEALEPWLVEAARHQFELRVEQNNMQSTKEGVKIFQRSIQDLVRVAPVIDEFKELDREIVENSIRFRWIDVRHQARKRLDPAGVCSSWQRRTKVEPDTESNAGRNT